MAVKKRPNKPVKACPVGEFSYVVLDLVVYSPEARHTGYTNKVAYAVFSDGVKLCECETSFGEPAVNEIHSAIKQDIKKKAVRLNLLKDLSGQVFKV